MGGIIFSILAYFLIGGMVTAMILDETDIGPTECAAIALFWPLFVIKFVFIGFFWVLSAVGSGAMNIAPKWWMPLRAFKMVPVTAFMLLFGIKKFYKEEAEL